MSLIMESTASQKIIKLVPTGYSRYAKQMMVLIQTKGLEDHITYDTFNDMFLARFPISNRELLLRKQLDAVKLKSLTKTYLQENKDAEVLALEEKLAAADEKKAKVEREWTVDEQKLKGLFLQTTDERYHYNIALCKSSAEIWKLLKKDSNQEEPGTMLALLSQYFNFKFVAGEKLLDFVARAQSIAQQIVELGKEPTWKEMLCYLILMKMPKEYFNIQQSLFQIDWKLLNVDLIIKKFSAEDSRQIANKQIQIDENKRPKPSQEEALAAEKFSKKKFNKGGAKPSPILSDKKCMSFATCKGFVPANVPNGVRCLDCHAKYKSEHPELCRQGRGNAKPNQPKKEDANAVHVLSLINNRGTQQKSKIWHLDSACTSHVTYSRAEIVNLRPANNLILGPSGESTRATTKGDALFQVSSADSTSTIKFKDALVVPKITKNLLSVRQICASSPDIFAIFNANKCQIFKGQVTLAGETLIQGQLDDAGLYAMSNKLDENAIKIGNNESIFNAAELNLDQALVSQSLQSWHECLGHINKKSILELQDAAEDFKVTHANEEISCKVCDAAKMNRKKFAPLIAPRADNVGEVIYSDICGKISPPTIGGCQYIIHFLDEKSGYIFAFIIKKKSEAFNLFKIVRARIKNATQSSIKMFATDGGGEYTGAEFQDFLKSKGIAHSKAPPNTHERVGKSERLNKILFDAARAMLTARKMPQKFWGLAVLHAAYVRNRTVKPGESKTRHELMFGKKPSLKHCLPFGCPVMLHNHDPHIKKLDTRAFKGIFVGFDESNHAYKIWNLETSQLIQSRDIKPYPDEFIDFPDYRAVPFVVENTNNWITGEPYADQSEDDLPTQPVDDLPTLPVDDLPIQPVHDLPIKPVVNNIPNNINDEDSEEDPIGEDVFGHPVYQINTNPINNIINNDNNNINNANRNSLTAEQIYEIETLDEIETPKTYKQAMKSPESKEWKEATQRELDSLIKNHTFDVVPRPPNVKILNAGLIFKIKPKDDNKASQFKARFVAKGYAQEYGIDYFETFIPTMRHASVKIRQHSAVSAIRPQLTFM